MDSTFRRRNQQGPTEAYPLPVHLAKGLQNILRVERPADAPAPVVPSPAPVEPEPSTALPLLNEDTVLTEFAEFAADLKDAPHHLDTALKPTWSPPPQSFAVWIGDLPPNATPDDLRAAFDKFGTIVNISPFKQDRKGRIFAFVNFRTIQEAARASAAMKGHVIGGHPIVTNVQMGKKSTANNSVKICIRVTEAVMRLLRQKRFQQILDLKSKCKVRIYGVQYRSRCITVQSHAMALVDWAREEIEKMIEEIAPDSPAPVRERQIDLTPKELEILNRDSAEILQELKLRYGVMCRVKDHSAHFFALYRESLELACNWIEEYLREELDRESKGPSSLAPSTLTVEGMPIPKGAQPAWAPIPGQPMPSPVPVGDETWATSQAVKAPPGPTAGGRPVLWNSLVFGSPLGYWPGARESSLS